MVCKKYYLEIVLIELETTSTYEKVNVCCEEVIQKHLEYMMSSDIKVEKQMEDLPAFYWLPKLHKKPYGTRFIAASNKCTTKELSTLLTYCFTTITNHFKQYCEGIFRNTGVNCFWIINNSQQVLTTIQNLNATTKPKCFNSFDFSTLYTNIPHGSLKSNLCELIREAFKVRGASYLIVDKNGKAHWSQTPSLSDKCRNIDMNKLIEMLDYLIDNIFIRVGNKVFRQTIGIPMGTDCAPLLANLFLFYYEYHYMKNLIRDNQCLAKSFNYTVRYIDDLLTFNNAKFETEITNIYPSELTLKRTTESATLLSYLDMTVYINHDRFSTTLYDKRDSFNFDIVNFPHMSSNIPSKPAYGVYISQLIRIGRICEDFSAYAKRHYKLTSRLIKQGFWYNKLCQKVFSKSHGHFF